MLREAGVVADKRALGGASSDHDGQQVARRRSHASPFHRPPANKKELTAQNRRYRLTLKFTL